MDLLHRLYDVIADYYQDAEIIDNFILVRHTDPLTVSRLIHHLANNLLITKEDNNTEIRIISNQIGNIVINLPYRLISNGAIHIINNIDIIEHLLGYLGISFNELTSISDGQQGIIFLIDNVDIGIGWLRSYLIKNNYPLSIQGITYNGKLGLHISNVNNMMNNCSYTAKEVSVKEDKI